MSIFKIFFLSFFLYSCGFLVDTSQENSGEEIKSVGFVYEVASDSNSMFSSPYYGTMLLLANGAIDFENYNYKYYAFSLDSMTRIRKEEFSIFDSLKLADPFEYMKPTFADVIMNLVYGVKDTIYVDTLFVTDTIDYSDRVLDIVTYIDGLVWKESHPFEADSLYSSYKIYDDGSYTLFFSDMYDIDSTDFYYVNRYGDEVLESEYNPSYYYEKVYNSKLRDPLVSDKIIQKTVNVNENGKSAFSNLYEYREVIFDDYNVNPIKIYNCFDDTIDFKWTGNSAELDKGIWRYKSSLEKTNEGYVFLVVEEDSLKFIFNDSLFLQEVQCANSNESKVLWGKRFVDGNLNEEYNCSKSVFYSNNRKQIDVVKRTYNYDGSRAVNGKVYVNDEFKWEIKFFYEYW